MCGALINGARRERRRRERPPPGERQRSSRGSQDRRPAGKVPWQRRQPDYIEIARGFGSTPLHKDGASVAGRRAAAGTRRPAMTLPPRYGATAHAARHRPRRATLPHPALLPTLPHPALARTTHAVAAACRTRRRPTCAILYISSSLLL